MRQTHYRPADLKGHAKEHDAASIATRQAAQRLHEQLRMDAPVTPANKTRLERDKSAPKPKPVKKIVPVKKPRRN